MKIVGLMSGTSLDGIDAALVDATPAERGYAFTIERFATTPFEPEFVTRLLAALPPNEPPPHEVAALDAELGRRFGAAARAIAQGVEIDFVASHGLTLFHNGAQRQTLQIGDPYAIRDLAGASVVCDLRRADCALGGQGAPLVPLVDALLFGAEDETRVALNLGGIANVTVLEPQRDVVAWDTGPANILLDALIRERTNGSERYDRDGARAARGRVDAASLNAMLADPYFVQVPPKSTGRERFGAAFLRRHAALLGPLSLDDACATLTELTARSIAESLARAGVATPALTIAGGGGSRNPTLLARLERHVGRVTTTADFGIDPDVKEALAFALLGYETLRGRPGALPAVTGARAAAVLGAIVPYELERLIAKMQAESREKTRR